MELVGVSSGPRPSLWVPAGPANCIHGERRLPPDYHRGVPIYEFECGSCGERFEELSSVGTEAATCPVCGIAGAERRLSSFGLTRQPTATQRRRMEDTRGTNRDGARQRFQSGLDKRRERKPGG